MNIVNKYIIKTDNGKTYSLYAMDASEYREGRYVGLFLYYDDDDFDDTERLWLNLRHRILFESSVDDVKGKILEYCEGRGEKIAFLEVDGSELLKH